MSDDALEELLRSSVPGFDAGFADRVVERVEGLSVDETARAVSGYFRRWAPLALAASLVLAAFNVVTTSQDGQSTFDAVLGLEPVSVQSAYAITVLDADNGEVGR
ncbi:MAG: hypothetical protein AAF389_05485 [Gemmatimonadota bacterium]